MKNSAGTYVIASYEVNILRDEIPLYVHHFRHMAGCALRNGWYAIAQQRLYDFASVAPRLEHMWCSSRDMSAEEVSDLKKRVIPDEIEDEIVSMCGGVDEAWTALQRQNVALLVENIETNLESIQKEAGKIKAILMVHALPSFRQAAERLGIPVIDLELAAIRMPRYRDTLAYFQFEPHFTTSEFDARWDAYRRESTKPPMLTRKEILALFLPHNELRRLDLVDEYEEFEFGVSLGHADDIESRDTGAPTIRELVTSTTRLGSEGSVIVRPFPGEDPAFNEDVQRDMSPDIFEFIARCRRVVCGASNVGLEAMLIGKTAYVLGPSPYAHFAVNSLDQTDECVIDLDRLNWMVFAFFAPYELVLNQDYLDWRLTWPSETEIYLRNLNHYLRKFGVDEDVVALTGRERLAAILRLRAECNELPMGRNRYDVRVVKEELESAIASLKLENAALSSECGSLEGKLESARSMGMRILRSRSWRMTAPVRAVGRTINRVTGRIVSIFRKTF